MSDRRDLEWENLCGEPVGAIQELSLKAITSKGPGEEVVFTESEDGWSFPKLSRIQMRRVEAMWRELGPAFCCRWEKVDNLWYQRCPGIQDALGSKMLFVDHYLYFVGEWRGSPFVVARAQGWSLPPMDENTTALIEDLKTRSSVAEKKLRICEENSAAKERELLQAKERRKDAKAAEKEEQLKLKKESASRRHEVRLENAGGELLALRCRKGNAAFSAGDWSR